MSTPIFPRRPSDPVIRFLGEPASRGGPFGLLALDPTQATPERIVQALERRLLRVAVHAESRTPAADEVRLALHAAAAQLLDPRVRARLIEQFAGATISDSAQTAPPASSGPRSDPLSASPPAPIAPPTGVPPSAPLPPEPESMTPDAMSRVLLERDAVLVIASEGGWTRRAMDRLLMFAHARGLTAEAVVAVLGRLAHGRSGPPQAAAPAASAGSPSVAPRSAGESFRIEPSNDVRKPVWLVVAVLATVLAASCAGLITLRWLGPKEGSGVPAPHAAGPASAATTARPKPRELFPADAPAAADVLAPADAGRSGGAVKAVVTADTLEAITSATAGLEIDPRQAGATLGRAIERLSGEWTSWPADRLIAAHDGILQYLHKSGPSSQESAIGLVVSLAKLGGAEMPRPTRAAWAVGLLARLTAERGLSATASGAARLGLASAVPDANPSESSTFAQGVWAALAEMRSSLTPASGRSTAGLTDAWAEWVSCADASAPDAAARARVLLVALDGLLHAGVEPTSDREVAGAVGVLAAALTWRADEESRRWLLRWFATPGVSAADLHAVTSVIASRSAAEGVDSTMVLSPRATDGERGELRTKYARAWKLAGDADRGTVLSSWVTAAKESCSSSGVARSDATATAAPLADAAVLSRLNAAAGLLWSGDADGAASLLSALHDPVRAALSSGTTPRPTAAADSGWAAKYLSAGTNAGARLELLRQFSPGSGIAPADAELIAIDAVRGSPSNVKQTARDLVRRHASSPAMVAAMLELAPTMPITQDSADLLASMIDLVPPVRDPGWRASVRAGLVQRLLELVADAGEFRGVEALARVLAASYELRAGGVRDGQSEPAPIERSAQALRERVLREASALPPSGLEPVSLAEARRRHAARLGIAEGLVQRFAAEQVGVFEAMSALLVAEDPSRASAVATIVADTARARRKADDIFVQIREVEQGLLSLWLIRLGGTP